MARKNWSASPRRGGRPSHGSAGRQAQSAAQSLSFSLQDEARNTENHRSEWTAASCLRNNRVTFVSASAGVTTQLVEDEQAEVETAAVVASTAHHDLGEMIIPVQLGPATMSTYAVPTAESLSPQHAVGSLSAEASPFSPSDPSADNLFVVDTTGQRPAVRRPRSPPRIPSSPAASGSDSSDEVIFKGRNTGARIVVDDSIRNESMPDDSLMTDEKQTSLVSTQTSSWDTGSTPWVHRSKPGVGWSIPSAKHQPAPAQRLVLELPPEKTQVEDGTLLQDRIDDIQAQAEDMDADSDIDLSTFQSRDLDGQLHGNTIYIAADDSSTSSEDETGDRVRRFYAAETARANEDDVEDEDEDEEDEDDSEDRDEDEDDSDDDVEDSIADELDLIERKMAQLDDENIARLLAKQDELGIDSNELLLYDDADIALEDVIAKEAASYNRRKPRKARNGRSTFPDASLFADVLEQDPYNGFDIMDFDRPSTRAKSKKGRPMFNLSDSELEATLEKAWNNDRLTKKAKKEEREALRAEGLLGSNTRKKKHIKPDLNAKYTEGLSVGDLKRELEIFLKSTNERLSLPPMHKETRKMVHELSSVFDLRSKSSGTGNGRYTTLSKSKHTIAFNGALFDARARLVNQGFFPRLDKHKYKNGANKSKASKESKAARPTRGGGGGGGGGVRYQDGDVVGEGVPELSADNRGRKLLEKMGWSVGTALGTDRQGILEPVAQVVKNSKAGLG